MAAGSSPTVQVNVAQPKPKGSIGLGAFAGFLLLVFLGFIPILGALIAGLVSGLIARGAGRGAAAGFLAGIAGAIILTFVLSIGGAALGAIFGQAGLGALIGGIGWRTRGTAHSRKRDSVSCGRANWWGDKAWVAWH